MYALIGYLVVTVVSGAVLARVTGWTHPPTPPRPTLDLADTARKVQSALASLAGFAVTSLVLLITLSSGRLDMHDERNVDLMALLIVSYLGFVVGGIMYAHTETFPSRPALDLGPALFAVASCQFFRSIVSGWLALAPLVAILGIDRLTNFVLALLLIAVLGGWIFHIANITVLGFGERRFAFVAPTVGIAGAIAYGLLVRAVPGLRSDDSLLFLVGAGAMIGATAHFVFHAARTFGTTIPDSIARWIRPIVLADAHASVILMAFSWLAVARLI